MMFAPLSLLLVVYPAGIAAKRPDISWGKAGVSRAAYEADAVACSRQAALRDVQGDRETQGYVQGFEALERENNMPPMARPTDDEGLIPQANRNVLLRRMYAPDRKVDALQAKLAGEVAACLSTRGYTRFALSKDQSRRLKRLAPGSSERRGYLHGLASDAAILSTQRAP
jgi:hypothetical protein